MPHTQTLSRTTAKYGEAKRWLEAFLKLDAHGEECVLWPFGTAGKGYGRVRRGLGEEYVHRVVLEYYEGPRPPDKDEAAHRCGTNNCINPNHLYWATRLENAQDKLEHGTVVKGEDHGQSKLTEEQALYILCSEERGVDLAEQFGVKPAQISRIRNGKRWSHLIKT